MCLRDREERARVRHKTWFTTLPGTLVVGPNAACERSLDDIHPAPDVDEWRAEFKQPLDYDPLAARHPRPEDESRRSEG